LKIENLVLEVWFVINQLKKNTLGCARTLSEASWLSTLEHLPHSSEAWRSIHILAVAVTNELHT